MKNVEQKKALSYARGFVEKGKLMQVATSKEDQPWIINCWYTFDDDWNFYFISGTQRRHILELRDNPKVACTITPHYILEELGQKVQGLHFEGVAEEVSGFGLTDVFNNFTAKWKIAKDHISVDKIKQGLCSKLYRVKATKLVWFDEINFPDEPRQEINL